jgi:predicted ATPase
MIISTINYSQNVGKADEWHLKNVNLGRLNLIVSRNGVGKTRTVNILNALARMLSGRIPVLLNGKWDVVFERDSGVLRYMLEIKGAKVFNERLSQNGKVVVERSGEEGAITYFMNGKPSKKKFYPPEDKLTNQVRRDKRELPYLEEMIKWGENYRSFSFSNIRPNYLVARVPARGGPTGPDMPAEDLSMAPYLLEEIQDDETSKRQMIEDLGHMGYKARDLSVAAPSIPGIPREVLVMRIIENGIDFPIDQMALSQGMYRAIASVVMFNHLMLRSTEGTLVIDDLGEGLDFERSSKLTEIIFNRVKNTGIQLIVTSNDRFLMNAVDLKYWNVFERKGKIVQSFNYKNSKKAFDDFALTGLNNFDFFADKLYKGKERD